MMAKNYKDFSKVCKFSASKSWARSIVLLIQFGVVGCADRGQIEKEVVRKENIANEQKKSQKTGSCELSGEKKEDLLQTKFSDLKLNMEEVRLGVVECADREKIEKEVVQQENITNEQKDPPQTEFHDLKLNTEEVQSGVVGCADRGQIIEEELVQKENIANGQEGESCELSGKRKENPSQTKFHELSSEKQWGKVELVIDGLTKRYGTLKSKELTLSSETLKRYSEEILKAQSDTEEILAAYRKFYDKNRSNKKLDTKNLWGELSLLHNSAAASANEISKLIDRLNMPPASVGPKEKESSASSLKLEEKWDKAQSIARKLMKRKNNLKNRELRLSSEILEEHRTKISEVHSGAEKALSEYCKFYDKNHSNKELGAENLLEGLRSLRKNMATSVNEMSEILNKLPKPIDSNCNSPERPSGNNVNTESTPVRNNVSRPSKECKTKGVVITSDALQPKNIEEIHQSSTEETKSTSQPESHGSGMSSRNSESDDNSYSSLRSNANNLIEKVEDASVKSQRSLNNGEKTLKRSTKKTKLRLFSWPITGVSNKKKKKQ